MNNILKSQRIWVTGASSGIGYASVLELSRKGARSIAISGRNISKLETLKNKLPDLNVVIVPFDVTSRQETLQARDQVVALLGGVDLVFLNAGASEHINIKAFDSFIFERMMQLNYMSLVYGVEAVLPLLRDSKAPHLVGMSSVAGYGGLPGAAAYCAAKAAARVFLESIKIDLLREQIPVSIVCPGFVKTSLTDKHTFKMPFLISVEQAAKIIVKGIQNKTDEIHFPKRMSVFLKLMNCLPAKYYAKLMSIADPYGK